MMRNPFVPLIAAMPSAVRGGFWLVISGIAFTSMMAVAKYLNRDTGLPVFEIVFWRAALGVCFMMPWLIRTGIIGVRARRWYLYPLRATLGFLALYCIITANTLMNLADVSAIGFTRSIFATIAAILLLGETAGIRRWSAILVGFIGALIVVRPGFVELNEGAYLALASVVITAFTAILIKFLSRTDSPDTMALLTISWLVPLSGIAAITVWVTPTFDQFIWLVLIGFLGSISQRSINRAYAATDAVVVQAFDFIRLPVAALIGFAVFSEVPDKWVWIGGAVIFAASVYIAHRESMIAKARRPISEKGGSPEEGAL